MNNNEILEARQAAQQLTMLELRKADQVFPRMRRAMEDAYGLPHGIFSKV